MFAPVSEIIYREDTGFNERGGGGGGGAGVGGGESKG